MVLTLAYRNLFHDRVRLAVTLVGILFSIVLVAVQLGLYLGARQMIIAMIENSNSDLWIMSQGAKSFEEGGVLSGRERHPALSVPGVYSVTPIVASFAEWRKPAGGATLSVVVGTDVADGALAPWSVVAGRSEELSAPNAVMVDRTYLKSLGVNYIGDTAQIESTRVKIIGMTDGIRSFTTAPYVFTSLQRARAMLGLSSEQATFLLVRLQVGADPLTTRQAILQKISGVEVLTKAEFTNRALDSWLYGTGAGVALIGGALLGLLVGTVIVAQTLYSSTKDHLREFATLRALGSSASYIHRVIMLQAGLSALIGYILGMIIALTVVKASVGSPLPIVMTPGLAAVLLLVTINMCAISAFAAIVKVTRIDPAMVFSR